MIVNSFQTYMYLCMFIYVNCISTRQIYRHNETPNLECCPNKKIRKYPDKLSHYTQQFRRWHLLLHLIQYIYMYIYIHNSYYKPYDWFVIGQTWTHIWLYSLKLLQFKTNKNKTCSAMLPIKSSTQFVHATSQTIFFFTC